MDVTADDKHDSEALPDLIANASRHRLMQEDRLRRRWAAETAFSTFKRLYGE